MKKQQFLSTLTILSCLALSGVFASVFMKTATPVAVTQGEPDVYLYDYGEWYNDTYSYADSYNWTWEYWVWGVNGSNDETWFIVQDFINYSEVVDQDWQDYYLYLYQDRSVTSNEPSNYTELAMDTTIWSGSNAMFEIWVWYSLYQVTSNSSHNFTIWNVNTDTNGDPSYDIDGYPVLTGEVDFSDFHPDNDTFDLDGGDTDYEDSFFDDWADWGSGNYSEPDYSYEQCEFGYQVNQYSGSWVESVNASDVIYSDAYSQFQGYIVYNDTNGNNVLDITVAEISAGEWDFEDTSTEWMYNIYYLNATGFSVDVSPANDSYYAEVSLTGIAAAIVSINDSLDDAIENGAAMLAYIPSDTLTFNLTWDANRTDLKVGHEIGTYFNYAAAQAAGFNVGSLSVMPELADLSLGINYGLNTYATVSSTEYTYVENEGDTCVVETDETWDLSIGDEDIMSFSANGTYTCDGLPYLQGLVVVPQWTYSAAMDYYMESEYDTATGSVDYSGNYVLLTICLDTWGGEAILLDPVFSTFLRSQAGGNPPPVVDGYSAIVILGVLTVLTAVLVHRRKFQQQ